MKFWKHSFGCGQSFHLGLGPRVGSKRAMRRWRLSVHVSFYDFKKNRALD